MSTLPDLTPPFDIFALIDRNTLLFDPRVMNALLFHMQNNLDMVQIVRLADQAAYDALTPEEKNDPLKIYVVPT